MRLYHNQLAATLIKNPLPIWLIFGDECWQKNDSIRQIKQHSAQQGFDETIQLVADDKFDWSSLAAEYQSMSLFSAQRIIEVELINAKVPESGSKVLQHLSENIDNNTLLILHGGKIEQASQRKKWFKSLAEKGAFLPLYDLDSKQLQHWLTRQANYYQLNISAELSALMTELFEGNLLALDQELQKLSLLFAQQPINVQDAIDILAKQAKFNPFNIIDTLLQGNINKCISMLMQQQQQGVAIAAIIWFIHKELHQLIKMKNELEQGQSLANIYKKFGIWDKRKALYQYALSHTSLENINIASARLAQVDLISKTQSDFNAFLLLGDVCASVFYGNITKNLSLDFGKY